jgi:hypothetical protein
LDARRVEAFAYENVGFSHRSDGKGGLDALMGGPIIILVSKKFSLWAGVSIRVKMEWCVRGWSKGNRRHGMEKVPNVACAKRSKTRFNCMIDIRGFVGLRRIKEDRVKAKE